MINEFVTEVQKEEWFKLSNGNIITNGATDAEVTLTYRKVLCVINVFTLYRKPVNRKGMTNLYSDTLQIKCSILCRKSKRTKSVPRAVRIVCEIFSDCIKMIESDLERLRTQEEAKQRAEEQQENVIQKFKLPVVQNEYNTKTLTFRMSKNFYLSFYYEGTPGNEVFRMQNIDGEFSSNQIEKFMNCLSECPEAAADRLINGK